MEEETEGLPPVFAGTAAEVGAALGGLIETPEEAPEGLDPLRAAGALWTLGDRLTREASAPWDPDASEVVLTFDEGGAVTVRALGFSTVSTPEEEG